MHWCLKALSRCVKSLIRARNDPQIITRWLALLFMGWFLPKPGSSPFSDRLLLSFCEVSNRVTKWSSEMVIVLSAQPKYIYWAEVGERDKWAVEIKKATKPPLSKKHLSFATSHLIPLGIFSFFGSISVLQNSKCCMWGVTKLTF